MKVNDDIGVGQKYVTKRVKSMSFLQISIFLLTNLKWVVPFSGWVKNMAQKGSKVCHFYKF